VSEGVDVEELASGPAQIASVPRRRFVSPRIKLSVGRWTSAEEAFVVSDRLAERCDLLLGLGRQAAAFPSGVRRGLVPRDVRDRRASTQGELGLVEMLRHPVA